MRRSPLSIYTPLLIVLLIQAVVIAVAPSRTATPTVGAAPLPSGIPAPPGATSAPNGVAAPAASGGQAATNGAVVATTPNGVATSVPTGAASTGQAAGTTPTPTTSTGSTSEPTAAVPAGDTSHCTPDGRQHDVTYHAPECEPRWEGGDNGGATYRGVTEDTVRVVLFRENKNEQVTAILNAYNLRATKAEDEEFMNAAEDFLNEFYEFHGRQVDLILFDAVNCPETPPDVPACRAEAKRAIAEHDPFMVLWPTPVYPDVFDEFVREGIIAIGGWHHDNSYFAGRRPYRWDVFMDGTRSADVIVEYACKKLQGNATHAGRIIHPSFPAGGDREQNPRKFGIIVPEPPATRIPAERAIAGLRDCGFEAEMYTYASDVTQSQQQSNATITSMIDDQVTSAICMCDPIAPVFRTETASRNNYFPEWVMAGIGLLDYDLLGRLYDKRQMAHAFGPSHLQLFPPHEQSDSSKVWRASGRDGNACPSCNLNTSYFLLAGAMIQGGGPQLTPFTVEQAMLGQRRGGWAETGGDASLVLSQFGPEDYTLISDYKEVYWSESAVSRIDGRPGAYVAMDGGERWQIGDLPSVFDVPQPAS